MYFSQVRHPQESVYTSLNSPDDALIVQNIYREIHLLLFF